MDDENEPLSFRERRQLLERDEWWRAVRRYLRVSMRLFAAVYRFLGTLLIAWIIWTHFSGGKP